MLHGFSGCGHRPYNGHAEFTLQRQFDIAIERDTAGFYVASVPELPGCHTQAKSLDEVMERIQEAIRLCLDVSDGARHPE